MQWRCARVIAYSSSRFCPSVVEAPILFELRVSDDGFVVTERGAQSKVAWSLCAFRESQNHFLLYKSADIYSIVPKRGFSGTADLDAFRDLATKAVARP